MYYFSIDCGGMQELIGIMSTGCEDSKNSVKCLTFLIMCAIMSGIRSISGKVNNTVESGWNIKKEAEKWDSLLIYCRFLG